MDRLIVDELVSEVETVQVGAVQLLVWFIDSHYVN